MSLQRVQTRTRATAFLGIVHVILVHDARDVPPKCYVWYAYSYCKLAVAYCIVATAVAGRTYYVSLFQFLGGSEGCYCKVDSQARIGIMDYSFELH